MIDAFFRHLRKRTYWIIGISLYLVACDPAPGSGSRTESAVNSFQSDFFYQLTQPVARYTLPDELEEISGLSYFADNQLLCVQDEEATAFVYNTQQQEITDTYSFGKTGDFEGVEWIKNEIYVLRSDGRIVHFAPGSGQVNEVAAELPKKHELEGLGYDPAGNRLVASVKAGDHGNGVALFVLDLAQPNAWEKLTLDNNQLTSVGIRTKQFKPSGIAVHPVTGDWYIISAVAKQLLVTDNQFVPKMVASLDPALFRQPEGICFAPNGDLYISSEGDGRNGYILAFAYKK